MQDSFTGVVGQYKLDSMFFCVLLYYLFIYLLILREIKKMKLCWEEGGKIWGTLGKRKEYEQNILHKLKK